MSAGGGSEEKTEKPTPKKLKESRKEGTVARTPEIGAWAGVLALAMSLNWMVGHGIEKITNLLGETLVAIDRPSDERALSLLGEAAQLMLVLSAAFGTFILVIAVIGAVAQGGLFFATKALKPKWSRLNPLEGAKRLFGPHALWEGAKMLVKSALVGVFVYRAVQDLMPLVGGLVPLSVAMEIAADAATGLMRDVAAAGLVAAGADYAMSRRRTMKQVRMTKKEIRDEHKNSEGDPLIKSALRSRQLAAARNRMMADIPEADVVLVNPTHVAVAIRYEPAKGTPRVVAKGAGAIATKIREAASEHEVSMVEDVPLARALYGACEVGQEIPPELYQAVAQVLAFVLSRKAAGHPAGRHRTPRDLAPLPDVPKHRRRTPAAASV
ncbi:EscU/YscU/HrcU family type III secretion system export apparatus switch protein [Nocardioides iriomotensis]|uniref:EscU/YscU/HrcU family type III secretion system export apparatus switch protein n=1 Tax=Nocardioides iriomotensis TaxID=715784 RepID=A0A4Q5IZ15_9ACTN|nr:EscU/YscU/HrcU family type III secretion system export apparatus switch protein [Nocardioides iriomotensis]RYU10528.1 EscU/YscU/HrcU family type III secretion system export apparatus switch protein [Nocardioides iriomotensis]